jgi:hypothetical protein
MLEVFHFLHEGLAWVAFEFATGYCMTAGAEGPPVAGALPTYEVCHAVGALEGSGNFFPVKEDDSVGFALMLGI